MNGLALDYLRHTTHLIQYKPVAQVKQRPFNYMYRYRCCHLAVQE